MVAKAREQRCEYCGEPVGFFAHSRSMDGPVLCGSADCNLEATRDARAERDEIRGRAESDDYERYRGGGW